MGWTDLNVSKISMVKSCAGSSTWNLIWNRQGNDLRFHLMRVESQDWVSILEEKDIIFDSSTPLPDENVSEDCYLQINKTDFTRKRVNRYLHCGLQNLPNFGKQTQV